MEIFDVIYEEVQFLNEIQILDLNLLNLSLSTLSLLFFLFFKRIIKKIILKKLLILFKFSNKPIKNSFSDSLENPINFLIISIGIFSASNILNAPEKTSFFLDKINLSLFTILIFWFLSKIIEPLAIKIRNIKSILTKDLLDWLISALKVIVFILGFSAVLELWGIKVGPIIAGLGLLGVAVALGAQDLFKNLISGILVLVEKRFKKGDVVIIDNVIEGSVEKIGFRSTAIRKFDKSLCFIPNYQFAENAVTNITEISNRRINWIVGVEYKSTIKQLRQICLDIEDVIRSNNKDFVVSNSTPVIVKISEFAPSSIDLLVRCFTKTNDYNKFVEAKDRLAIDIKKIIEKRKAAFAFPSQSLYIEK